MSTSYHVYCGPYVRTHNKKQGRTITHRSCLNEKCSQHKDVITKNDINFCSSCGDAIGEVSYQSEQRTIPVYDLVQKLQERLRPVTDSNCSSIPEYVDLWISNMWGTGASREYNAPSHVDQFIPVCVELMVKDIEEFMRTYAEQINKLREAYGEVEIEWGVIQYFN